MEYRDLFDKNRKTTGEKVAKGEKFDDGKFIVVVMVFIENSKGEILLQKRSKAKGGKWATTGGHPTAGQSSLEGMRQELKEEIGVDVDKSELVLFKTVKTPKTFVDLYYLHKDIDLKDTKLQESEVQDIGWFTKSQIEDLVKNGQFFMPHYQGAYLEYLKLDFGGKNGKIRS